MINELRSCSDRKDLAVLLGVKPSELSYLLYIMPNATKYTPFCISKKNGGTRNILAPTPRLKFIQRQLLDLLYECEEDYTSAHSNPNLSFGFRRNHSIYDNAYRHRCRSYVFNIDIEGFFDQFNLGRVRGFFIKDRRFALHPNVATTIAQIACFDDKLPQGSPCSPHIANLCSTFFDLRMVRFLRPLRCRYSRYADDITISTDLSYFPSLVAIANNNDAQGWCVSDELNDLFQRSGFTINTSKLRMGRYFSRQMVTGLVVNDRPNVSREYYTTTRAMCHRLFKGEPLEVGLFCDEFSNNCSPQSPVELPDPKRHLEGRLAFIDHVRERADLRSLREKQDNPTQFFTTLLKFNIFNYFFGNDKPTVLTEGPSDVSYLRASAKTTAQTIDQLYSGSTFRVRFFRFKSRAAQVLGITGGCGTLKRFLYLYKQYTQEFSPAGERHPVILLVDNDKAGRDVAHMINGMYKTSINMSDPKLWSRIAKHLYLVKTPLASGQTDSCIEDSLPPAVRNITLNGKTFSPLTDFDATKHFGKVALAAYVHANKGTISLSGFDPLLAAIEEAIADSYS